MSAVIVDGMISVPRGLLTDATIRVDQRMLSVPHPQRMRAMRARVPCFLLPERLSLMNVGANAIKYPGACMDLVRRRLHGDVVIVDHRPRFDAKPAPYRGRLFPFQMTALNAALASTRGGIIVAPCGAGKGELIAALVGELGLPTLIATPTKDLARDLQGRLQDRLAIACGFMGDGVRDVQRVTVAVAAALTPDALQDLARSFEVLVFDECHHVASSSWQAISHGLAVRKRFGFTATPERQDGLTPFLELLVGPILHRVSRSDLNDAGRSTLPEYRQVPTNFGFRYCSQDDWHALQTALANDEQRDELIAGIVAADCMPHPTAVLVGRVEHAARLAARLSTNGIRAAALFGKLSGKKRAAILDSMRTGKLDVIVATSLADEGLDLPNLTRLVLAWPQRAEGRFVQRVGRILRVQEGKATPQVFDLVDSVGPLKYQAKSRARTFAREFSAVEVAA
jgi:superfamily II DNA or RNA helicase